MTEFQEMVIVLLDAMEREYEQYRLRFAVSSHYGLNCSSRLVQQRVEGLLDFLEYNNEPS